jgi:hypothetical protein
MITHDDLDLDKEVGGPMVEARMAVGLRHWVYLAKKANYTFSRILITRRESTWCSRSAPKPLPSWPGGWDGQPGLLRVQAGSPNTQDLSRNPPALAGP